MFTNQTLIWRELASMRGAGQLAHIDSDLCWCDPVVEIDEDGRHVVVHSEVTWH